MLPHAMVAHSDMDSCEEAAVTVPALFGAMVGAVRREALVPPWVVGADALEVLPHPCPFPRCGASFDTLLQRRRHIKHLHPGQVPNGANVFGCFCEAVFPGDVLALMNHMVVCPRAGFVRARCLVAPFMVGSVIMAAAMEAASLGIVPTGLHGPFQCCLPGCGAWLGTPDAMLSHFSAHNSVMFLCNVPGCSFAATNPARMHLHRVFFHGKDPLMGPYSCDVPGCRCDTPLVTFMDLHAHRIFCRRGMIPMRHDEAAPSL